MHIFKFSKIKQIKYKYFGPIFSNPVIQSSQSSKKISHFWEMYKQANPVVLQLSEE